MKKLFTVLLAMIMLVTMTVTAMAAKDDFVPSIEIKPGPGIVDGTVEGGGGAVIIMPDGTEVVVPESDIIIIPVSKSEEADSPMKEELEGAYKDIEDAESLEDLVEDLQDVLGDVPVDNVAVKDLIYIGVTGENAEVLANGGVLQITLDVDTDIPAVLFKDGDVWSTLSGDSVKLNGDGTVTLKITAAGVYAFLKNVGNVNVDTENPDVSSPTTGDSTLMYVIAAAVMFAVSALLFVAAKKQEA